MNQERTSEVSEVARQVMRAAVNGNPHLIDDPVYRQCIAAALRAAAVVVMPDPMGSRSRLLLIAAELERVDGPDVQSREPASIVTDTRSPTDLELYEYWVDTSPKFGCADPVGFARAVLARWGNP